MTMLGLMERLLMNQMQTQASQRNTEATMNLVNDIIQPTHPRTFKQAKELVTKTCMTHARQIHACINDCIVFYNSPRLREYQHFHREECPRCGAGRYHKGTKTPVRVFHYIPIRDHVDALFCRHDVVEAFVRDGEGLPHGGNMNKTWSDLTDSPEWERVVHQDDFGNEVRVTNSLLRFVNRFHSLFDRSIIVNAFDIYSSIVFCSRVVVSKPGMAGRQRWCGILGRSQYVGFCKFHR